MRKIIVGTVVALICLSGCSSEQSPAEPQEAPSSVPAYDPEALQREAWEQSSETYTAALKLNICKQGGADAIAEFLVSEDMPFVVDDPEYAAEQWAEWCAGPGD